MNAVAARTTSASEAQAGPHGTSPATASPMPRTGIAEHLPIAIIGAGIGGICLAIKLREAGIEDFTMLEAADAMGGSWYLNHYPGCACDVPSALYSYSFDQNPDWSRKYGTQPEILEYLQGVAQRHEVGAHVRYRHEVLSAHWDEAQQLWRIVTSKGNFTAGVLVSACGPFNDPQYPKIPGMERFQGPAFHTARWDHGQDLKGKRVAVIGTGASAIQVVPAIQPIVDQLLVFQRTPTWIVPRWDREKTGFERALLKRVPALREAVRSGWYLGIESLGLSLFLDRRLVWPFEALGRWQLRRQVADPVLRARLTPDFRLGCKRAVFSDSYYPALTQPNVDLITDGIREIREQSIVTADGSEHEVDVIVYATGFHVPGKIYQRIHGRDGRSMAEVFGTAPNSYLGTTFNGCPNLFTMLGPFSAGGNQSAIFMLENQSRYIIDALLTMRDKHIATIEPREEVQTRFHEEMKRRSRETTWVTGGCRSYYQNPEGGNGGLWPNWSFTYRWRTRQFDAASYTLTRRPNFGTELRT